MHRLPILITLLAFLAGSSLALAQAKKGDPVKGKQVYMTFCVTCHGPNGDGKGPVGKALNPPPRDFSKAEFKYGSTDQDLFNTISNGAAAKGGSALMAPWGAVIPETDRWAVIAFIHSFRK